MRRIMSFIEKLFHDKEESLKEALKERYHPKDIEEEDPELEDEKAEDTADSSEEEKEEDPDAEYEVVEREILPTKIICPDCGGITLEGLEFCDKCGGELQ
jgi:hypothetical protein